MKSERNILIAFLLNMFFSIFEVIGGIFTGSVAIISDAVHDFGDAISIGISYILEKKSKKKPDNNYTFGYRRYSVLGAFITNIILVIGSVVVIINSIKRIINPIEIDYNGMMILAIIGVIVNFVAVYFTKDGESLNLKAVNLHMLEDVLGWVVVLIGAITIKFTNITVIDPIMSIWVAIFILNHALNGFKKIIDLFLEKTPNGIKIDKIREHLLKIENVIDIHHIHIWSIDGVNNYATMHVVTKLKDIKKLKNKIREEMKEYGVDHTTIEIEEENEKCDEIECDLKFKEHSHAQHNHIH